MLKKIRKRIKEKQRVKGLSKAMSIVDEYMRPGLNERAVDFSAGYAQARIQMLYEEGSITKAEMEAALFTLENQHDKLYRKAVEASVIK